MQKPRSSRIVILASVIAAVFAFAFYLGRTTVPYAISITAAHPDALENVQQEAELHENPVRAMPMQEEAERIESAASEMPLQAETALPEEEQPDRIDLNMATKEELMTLPRIGEKLAERILAYRQSVGRFSVAEQIMDVEGIGEGTFEAIRERITVEGTP